jgi:hypothetical protein
MANVSTLQWQPKKAWAYMLLYWTIGWTIGFYAGYLSELIDYLQDPVGVLATFPAVIACALTAVIQVHLNTRYSKFDRQSNILVALIFSVCNGTAETMLFLASYDVGRAQIGNALNCSKVVAVSIGFVTFSIYSGLIHAFFWDKMVFPMHLRVDAPSFAKDGLPSLLLLSTIWFTLYETQSGGIALICFLHALVDFWMAMTIGLQSPFTIVKPK